jgi:hypothetical protein
MDNTEVDSRSSIIIDPTVLIAGFSLMFFCSRILWKSKKDGLKDKEVNTDVTSHLAYAIVATIVTVKQNLHTEMRLYPHI